MHLRAESFRASHAPARISGSASQDVPHNPTRSVRPCRSSPGPGPGENSKGGVVGGTAVVVVVVAVQVVFLKRGRVHVLLPLVSYCMNYSALASGWIDLGGAGWGGFGTTSPSAVR